MVVNVIYDQGFLESVDFVYLVVGFFGFIVCDFKLNKFGFWFLGYGM